MSTLADRPRHVHRDHRPRHGQRRRRGRMRSSGDEERAGERWRRVTRCRLVCVIRLADQPLGDDDGEDDDGDDAARVEQELHRGEELGVEQQEDARRRRQRQRQPEHGVEEVLGQDHREGRADEDDGERPRRLSTRGSLRLGLRLRRLAGACCGARPSAALFGRRLHVAQPVAGRPRRLELQADGVQPVLVEQELAAVASWPGRTTSS